MTTQSLLTQRSRHFRSGFSTCGFLFLFAVLCGSNAWAQVEDYRSMTPDFRVEPRGENSTGRSGVGIRVEVSQKKEAARPIHLLPGQRVPYDGGDVPPGTSLETRSRRYLVIPGFVTLGVGYGTSVAFSLVTFVNDFSFFSPPTACEDTNAWNLVPLIGAGVSSISYAAYRCGSNSGAANERVAFGLLTSGAQVAGLSMAIIGLVDREKYLVGDEASASNKPSWTVVAGTQATPSGMTLAARF